MTFRVHVRITPRQGLLDPQGQAVKHALDSLGFSGVASVNVGRAIEIVIDAASANDAEKSAMEMCDKLLANPVTEDFVVTVES